MSEGYIKLYRQTINWEWYKSANVTRLFLHCLLSANHKENKWQGITICAGSFITSISKLADSLKLTNQQVRTALNRLKSTGEITCKSTSQYTLITINNWHLYQANNILNNNQVTNG